MNRELKAPLFAVSLVVIAYFSGNTALAADSTWIGTQSSDWYNSANWDSYPGTSSTNVIIDVTSPNGTIVSGGAPDIATLYVGKSHTGALGIQSGAFMSAGQVWLGDLVGSSGVLGMSGGSTLNISSNLYVGNDGTAEMTISAGGIVQDNNTTMAEDFGSHGQVLVTGAGSEWQSLGTAIIGSAGTATVQVSSGGHFSSADAIIADGSSGSGTVTVMGTGSQWSINGDVTVGAYSSGTVTVSAGGVVTTSGDASLGDQQNSQGTVTVDGAQSSWTVNHLTVGNRGNGTLTITNGGTVSDTQGWIGSFGTSTASVHVDGASSSWSNGANGILIGFVGTGSLTISNGADVSSQGTVTIASIAGSHGTLNIGADKNSAALAPGTLTADNLLFGDGAGEIVFNHTGNCYDFTTQIAGHGTISQMAGCTLMHVDDSAFAGATNITGGALVVNNPGSLSHSVVTVSGGALEGDGTIGGIVANSGGTVAPGSDGFMGNLKVNGNVAFNPGSTYLVKTDASGNSDKISVNGSASLQGGTVSVVASGSLPTAMQYTILTASGGVSGQFDGATTNYAFLNAILGYDADDVFLTLSQNGIGFADIGVTPNERASAGGAQALGPGSPIYDAILGLSAHDADQAFDALSGERASCWMMAASRERQRSIAFGQLLATLVLPMSVAITIRVAIRSRRPQPTLEPSSGAEVSARGVPSTGTVMQLPWTEPSGVC